MIVRERTLWLLLGFGDHVLVEKPAILRNAIKERIDNLGEWYSN
jgi:predicted DNA-binding transcriptional regulator YafY